METSYTSSGSISLITLGLRMCCLQGWDEKKFVRASMAGDTAKMERNYGFARVILRHSEFR